MAAKAPEFISSKGGLVEKGKSLKIDFLICFFQPCGPGYDSAEYVGEGGMKFL
jgi:hypothetical protein